MHNFKNRKFLLLLMLAAAVFFVFVLLDDVGIWYKAALSALLATAFFALGGGFSKRWASAVFACFLLASALLSAFYGVKIAEKNKFALSFANGEEFSVKAEVREVRFTSAYASSYLIDILSVGDENKGFCAILEIEKGSSFKRGDIISFEAVFTETEEEKAYLRGKNIFVCAAAEDAVRTGRANEGVLDKFAKANDHLASRFVKLLGREAGGFCSAIILGNKSYIGTGMKLDFSRSGISHLLALSGLHLAVLSGSLDFILRGFVRKKARGVILIISCFAFAAFTGFSASVIRASVMLAFVYAADIFGEENDSLAALFSAVWIIFLINGNSVYDVGFLLSVAATLGIILTRPACEAVFSRWQATRKNELMRAIRSVAKYFYGIFTMSAAASFFTLPIMGFAFGEVSWVGIFANFVFLPLATILLVFCVAFILLSYVPVFSGALAFACKSLSQAIIALAAFVSDLRGVTISLRYPFVPYLLFLLCLGLAACIFIKKLTPAKLCSGMLAFVLSFAACFGFYDRITAGDMSVRIGSGRSGEYVAFLADGENYVVDASTGGYSFLYEALGSREYFCETEIDNLVLTHYHTHHTGSLERLCDSVKIRRVLLPAPETESESESFASITSLLNEKGIKAEVYVRGDVYKNGNVSIDFAPLKKISRSEKPLLAFKIAYGGATFSYIEGAAMESAFDYSGYLFADTVFVGAHGPSRKFGVYADVFANAGRVVFAVGARERFSGTEHLSSVYELEDYGGEMKILYDN